MCLVPCARLLEARSTPGLFAAFDECLLSGGILLSRLQMDNSERVANNGIGENLRSSTPVPPRDRCLSDTDQWLSQRCSSRLFLQLIPHHVRDIGISVFGVPTLSLSASITHLERSFHKLSAQNWSLIAAPFICMGRDVPGEG